MDLSRIKQFVKKNGDKFVIVENGEPEMVVMSFEEYSRMANGGSFTTPLPESRDFTPVATAGFTHRPPYAAGAIKKAEEGTEFVVDEINSRIFPQGAEPDEKNLKNTFIPAASPYRLNLAVEARPQGIREGAGIKDSHEVVEMRPEEVRLEDLPL